MRQYALFFICTFISLCASLQAAKEQDLLKAADVNRIMSQILENHVDKKEMTAKVLQSALITYIDQFDPSHLYLLQEEVAPFIHLTDAQLKQIADQYKQNNFTIFQKLNDLIQRSIKRSREFRRSLNNQQEAIFDQALKKDLANINLNMPDTFAKNTNELKERLKDYLTLFIEVQRRRYGDALVLKNKEKLMQLYNNALKEFENPYMNEDDEGHRLAQDQQENIFIIHILKAMASSLDAHTSFYQANEAYDLRVRLQKEFQGVGITLKDSPDGAVVVSLLDGGPAARTGLIKTGDILLEVDGQAIKDYPFQKIMQMLHGDKGSSIKLVFKRKAENNKPEKIFSTEMKREAIVLNNDRVDVSWERFGNGIIGIIKLHAFYQNDEGVTSEKDVREAIEKLDKKGNLRGLILDLRDNSGGFLSQAVKVAGLFISNGVIVVSKYSNGDERFYRDVNSQISYDGPLVILTSKATASAAEIVAQALQDYGVAVVVGDEHTYGKGTIQTQTVTNNESTSYFKVTVGKYYTVSGKTPQKQGVKADIIVPGHWSHEKIGEEFVDSVEPDVISPAFEDSLKDIAPDVKPWYLKYYMPKLQHKKEVWQSMIPTLKKNSEYRISNNKNYQFYLKHGEAPPKEEDDDDDSWMQAGTRKKKNYGEDDLQTQEAVNIVKDIILLHESESK